MGKTKNKFQKKMHAGFKLMIVVASVVDPITEKTINSWEQRGPMFMTAGGAHLYALRQYPGRKFHIEGVRVNSRPIDVPALVPKEKKYADIAVS